MFRNLLLVLLFGAGALAATAQDLPALRRDIDTLCSGYFAGRGYTDSGMARAARWLGRRFAETGLTPFGKDYLQHYVFPVNTFPGKMSLQLDGKPVAPGSGFLVIPASPGAEANDLRIVPVDLARIKEEKAWQQMKAEMGQGSNRAYLLLHLDRLKSTTGRAEQALLAELDRGIYLLPETGKPLWSVATGAQAATVVRVYDSLIAERLPKRLSLHIEHQFIPQFPAANIAGYVPGREQPDSFIVVTAHYDHLGKMGADALFPGASDNASGTAMLLALARFYAAHPGRYSIAFILFGGEEAGLIGSSYYVAHPLFPLHRIRFLINLDILGDASNGITVVNGSVHPEAFRQLEQLNQMDPGEPAGRKYVPAIEARGEAANSDHYPFSLKGVPAFFIYSRGGKGFYHDTRDDAASLSLAHIPALSTLLKRFISGLQ